MTELLLNSDPLMIGGKTGYGEINC